MFSLTFTLQARKTWDLSFHPCPMLLNRIGGFPKRWNSAVKEKLLGLETGIHDCKVMNVVLFELFELQLHSVEARENYDMRKRRERGCAEVPQK